MKEVYEVIATDYQDGAGEAMLMEHQKDAQTMQAFLRLNGSTLHIDRNNTSYEMFHKPVFTCAKHAMEYMLRENRVVNMLDNWLDLHEDQYRDYPNLLIYVEDIGHLTGVYRIVPKLWRAREKSLEICAKTHDIHISVFEVLATRHEYTISDPFSVLAPLLKQARELMHQEGVDPS